MRINVRLTFNSQTKTIIVPDDTQTVVQLKEIISTQVVDLGDFRLVFAGKVMKDEENLAEIGVKDNVTLHLVRSKTPAKAPEPTQKEPEAAPREPNFYTGPIAGEQQQTQQQAQPNPFGGMGMGGMPGMNPMGGFPGMGMPGMGMGGMNPNDMMNMISQNPQMLDEAINLIAQNPAMIKSMLMMNPMTAQMMQNPQMASMIEGMLSNPQMLRMMLNPQMMQMASQMGGMGGMGMPGMGMGDMGMPQQPTQNPQPTQPQQNANPFGALFGNPMGMPQQPMQPMQSQPTMQTPMQQQSTQERSPQEIYQTQLAALKDMGFFDEQENIRALQRTGGNVNAAVELLLSGPQY